MRTLTIPREGDVDVALRSERARPGVRTLTIPRDGDVPVALRPGPRSGVVPTEVEVPAGYQRLWPLASWATVDAGSSGVTYTEHTDGIEWTIPAGPADVATPELAWRATGPVSAVVPQLAPAPTWWGLQCTLALLERTVDLGSSLWVAVYLHAGPLDVEGAVGGILAYPGSRRLLYSYRGASSWVQPSAPGVAAPLARGLALDLPDVYQPDSRRVLNVLGVTADGDLTGERSTNLDTVPWDRAVEPRITVAVGRVSEGASGILRAAPQALLSISSLAQEGTP